MIKSKLFITTLTALLFHTGIALGQVTTFTWSPVDTTSGVGAVFGIQADYDLPPVAEIRNYAVENQTVIDNYTGTLQGFQIGRGIDEGSGSFTFSQPLPDGSILFFQDLDFEESVTMTTNTPISFIENIESLNGSLSDVVSFDSTTQTVSAFSGSRSNGGLTILDASGLTSLSYTLDMPNNSSAGIGFAVAAIPEPNSAAIVAFGGVSLLFRRRRTNRNWASR